MNQTPSSPSVESSSDMNTQEKSGKRFRLGRFVRTLIIICAVLINIWTFIELQQISLLVVSVDLSQTELNLFENESHSLYTDIRSYGLSETLGLSEPEVSWSSDNTECVQVSEDGTITAVAPGTAVVTAAESRSGISCDCTITVHSLTDIILNASDKSLGVGESFSLNAAVSGNDMAEPFVFSSSDSTIASVDSSGVVTALKPGEASITVSARGYTQNSCSISVFNPPTAIDTSTLSTEICVGEKRTVVVSSSDGEFCSQYTYTSSDPEVLTVDSNGQINALSKGTASVSITAYNGVSASVDYTVSAAPRFVELNKDKITIFSGYTDTVSARDSSGSCQEYYYSSSDTSVATVDEFGTITAHNRGQAVITCTSFNGKSDTCTVNVKIVHYTTPYTSQRVQQNIAALTSTYPELITSEVIGKSVMGRDITLVKLGTGERKAFIVAGMHSREGIGVTFTMRCIEEYANAFYSKSGKYGSYNVKDMLSEFTLYIVPLMNPDGLDVVNDNIDPLYNIPEDFNRPKFKNNANGVNLNRNFPFHWGYSDNKNAVNVTTPDALSYAGTHAGSEPETQAIMKLCQENEFEWLLDVHCRGNIIYYQDTENEVTAADNRLASRLARKCGFVLTDQSTLYEISGGLENWFRSEFGKPGICIELVESQYSYLVNDAFERKLNWSKTKYAFLLGMLD